MKLSDWARKKGITYRAAYNWFKKGIIPAKVIQLPTGTILVEEEPKPEGEVVIYARVSSTDQKSDLDRQVSRLSQFATSQGLKVSRIVTEIASGLNGKRKKLLSILRDPSITTIVVEHKDRLVRFGFELLEAVLLSNNKKIIVMEKDELNNDLVQDMIDILTSFCARLYGKRSAKNKVRKVMELIQKDENKKDV